MGTYLFAKIGIVSKGVREPVDRLTLFAGTFRSATLNKAIHYKHIVVLPGNEWSLKSVNLLPRSVRQSPVAEGVASHRHAITPFQRGQEIPA